MRPSSFARGAIIAVGLFVAGTVPLSAQHPIQFGTAQSPTSVTLGVLAQGSLQVESAPQADAATDFCLRRLRFIAGGKVARKLRFFADSDTSYLGHHGALGWTSPPTILQDAFVTYEIHRGLQIDAGLMLVPLSYNGTQSAASLLPIAYGPYSFVASVPTHSRVGRDQGVSARGYLFKQRLEYRVGTYRGAGKHLDNVPLRYAGRVVWYPAGAQTGYFYSGTQHGKRTLVGIGASLDHQDRYNAYGVDAFAEWKTLAGHTLTTQVDVVRYDGSITFPQLLRQHTWLTEVGYQLRRPHIGPFIQIAGQDIARASAADSASIQGGMSYWLKGHTMNLKAAVGRTLRDGVPSHTLFTMQSQLLVF